MKATVKVYRLAAFYPSDAREFLAEAKDLDYIIVDEHDYCVEFTVVIDADHVEEFKSLVSKCFACSYSLTEIY